MWTIGHGTRSLDELVDLLRRHDVARLVDVRRIPGSRRNPQFDRATLPGALASAVIGYTHLPGLGGLRRPRPDSINTGWRQHAFRGYADYMQSQEFAEQLAALIALAAESPAAIMCAETVPWRCHRTLIADALETRDIPVLHILGPTRADRHVLTPWARREGTTLTYPAKATREQ